MCVDPFQQRSMNRSRQTHMLTVRKLGSSSMTVYWVLPRSLTGGAILGQQDIASMQILMHQQPVVHLGQAGCHLLQHHHHLLSAKPAVQVKSVSDTSGLAFADSASSTVACLKTVNTIQPNAWQSSAQKIRPGCRQGADIPMCCQSALCMIQHDT